MNSKRVQSYLIEPFFTLNVGLLCDYLNEESSSCYMETILSSHLHKNWDFFINLFWRIDAYWWV
jgi:hypothetical protein